MVFQIRCFKFASGLIAIILLAGCGKEISSGATDVSGSPPEMAHDHTEDGSHEGPHGGHVIELGRSHQYHAELVENDDTESVSIYILDKDLKELPIQSSTISLNLMVGDQAMNYELVATLATDGLTSRFDSSDEELFHTLHDEAEVVGTLRATIDGTPFTGEIHHHGHAGAHDGQHDHDHSHDNH